MFQDIAIRELELGVFKGREVLEYTDSFEVFESGLDRAGGEVGELSDFTGTELEFPYLVGFVSPVTIAIYIAWWSPGKSSAKQSC